MYPHLIHRKNCVDDSSDPRVCTCQTLAELLLHLGHVICSVGNVLSCSSLPMTATNCFGSCSITLPLNLAARLASCFLKWHLVQTSISNCCFPNVTIFGTSREPHSAHRAKRSNQGGFPSPLQDQGTCLGQPRLQLRQGLGAHRAG